VILEAGPDEASRKDTLMLVATGSVVRDCNVQRPLIALLCSYGADPNSAIRDAAVLNELNSVLALLEEGANLDLPLAAALGRLRDCQRLITTSSSHDRHLALALASQYGRIEIVRLLVAGGERPDRYNPPDGHSHATPLHQAAASGYLDVVRLLVEHGARLDLRDVLWHGTPADWAAHEGQTEVEMFLRGEEQKQTENQNDPSE
jgi:ankyrin repeat protein